MTKSLPMKATVRRDRFGRYVLPLPPGEDPAIGGPLSRVTTIAGAIENEYYLQLWRQRMVAVGLLQRKDLYAQLGAILASGADYHKDDVTKKQLNDICSAAFEAAGGGSRATIGTALHTYTEMLDAGHAPVVPDPWDKDLVVYQETTSARNIKHFETEVICVKWGQWAGTADRFSEIQNQRLIVDLKGLAVDTAIPTPTGWTTMGALVVGDQVIGGNGQPCSVTLKSEVSWKDCFRITFDDGSSVIADTDHRWVVAAGVANKYLMNREIKTTRDLYLDYERSQKEGISAGEKAKFLNRVMMYPGMELPDVDLPLHPYVLGVWLGDGNRSRNVVTKPADHPIWKILTDKCGVRLGTPQVDKRTGCTSFTLLDLFPVMQSMGILNNKHIPERYLRASFNQRLALLQGLMDTDGCWNIARNQAVFALTDKALVFQVKELALSLGLKAKVHTHDGHGFGKDVTVYALTFTPVSGLNPFKARANLLNDWQPKMIKSDRRIIKKVESVPTVPTQCIAVDSLDNTYLCTEDFIVTHNTGEDVKKFAAGSIAIQLSMYADSDWLYDPAKNKYRPMHEDIDKKHGLVIHLPAGEAKCTLYWVDLDKGRRGRELAIAVRAWREEKGGDFFTEWTGDLPQDSLAARREGFLTRIDTIKQLGGLDLLRKRWPADLPTLKNSGEHTSEQLDNIDSILAFVEKQLQAPFPEQVDNGNERHLKLVKEGKK